MIRYRLIVVLAMVAGCEIPTSKNSMNEVEEEKYVSPEELDKIPEGLKVVHEPGVVLATLTGKSERRSKYTWWYKTTVTPIKGDVTIVQFAGYIWRDGKWVVASAPRKPYTPKEFAEWYSCPMAILKEGKTYTDPTNWSTDPELRVHKTRWYYIGVDASGKRVKGEAIVDLKAEIDPKKPKDRD